MSEQLLTPIDHKGGQVVDLAGKPGLFRKQILRKSEIDYDGQKVSFDDQFLADLAASFKGGAMDAVPLQLADADNKHTNDVERTGGHLVDVELTADGLDGIFDLNPRGLAVLQDHRNKVGVSASIYKNHTRADGKSFPAALRHVLATVDPRLNGLRPWEKVNLAADAAVTKTIDLSAEVYPGGTEGKMSDTKTDEGKLVSLQLTAEQAKNLLELAAENEELKKLDLKAEDFEEVEDEEDDKVTPPAPAPVADPKTELANGDATATIELARSTAEAASAQVLELTNQLRAARVENEIEKLRETGLAPAIIEAARPALEGSPAVLNLANGKTTDTGAVVRKVLHEVISLAQSGHDLIDLGQESGVLVGTDTVTEARGAFLAAVSAQFDN